jgi:hypothetical protein
MQLSAAFAGACRMVPAFLCSAMLFPAAQERTGLRGWHAGGRCCLWRGSAALCARHWPAWARAGKLGVMGAPECGMSSAIVSMTAKSVPGRAKRDKHCSGRSKVSQSCDSCFMCLIVLCYAGNQRTRMVLHARATPEIASAAENAAGNQLCLLCRL